MFRTFAWLSLVLFFCSALVAQDQSQEVKVNVEVNVNLNQGTGKAPAVRSGPAPTWQGSFRLRTNDHGILTSLEKHPVTPAHDFMDILYTGCLKRFDGPASERHDLTLYLRKRNVTTGSGWGTGMFPARMGGLFKLMEISHADLFNAAVRGRTRGIYPVYQTIFDDCMVPAIIKGINVAFYRPDLPPPTADFSVDLEVRTYPPGVRIVCR